MLGLTPHQAIFLVILVVAFALLLTERLRNDVVAVLIILSLVLTGVLTPEEGLSGFGSEAAVVVAAIFILSEGIRQTGLSEIIGGLIGRFAGRSVSRALMVIMPSVALLSAVTHHLTMTAVMLPVTLNLSRERDLSSSKLLMPLSIAASLGTTIAVIGAPAFLIASGVLQQAGRPGLGIFSIAPIGLVLTLVGTLFMLLVGQFLLPAHKASGDTGTRFRLDAYFTELVLLPDSPLLGRTAAELRADDRYDFQTVGVMRRGQRLRGAWERHRLSEDDVLLIRTTPEELVEIRQSAGVELRPVAKYGARERNGGGADNEVTDQMAQAVLAPNSDLIGRTIGELDFHKRYGAIVVSLWRKRAWLNEELSQIILRAGDVLVIHGDEEALERVGGDPNFLMLVPFQGEARARRRAWLAGLIMLAAIVAAATGTVSIEIAALAGAAAMVLSRCMTARQAYRAVDSRIYVFIAGALPLGLAMEKSGTSELLASWMQNAVGGWSQPLILALIFSVVAVLTQFMSDAATTAVIAPVAVALARALGMAPEAFVVTVAMAAVASFLTPIGHHGNLLVYGPGRYRFTDFVKVGTPLTALIGLIVVIMAPMLWPG